tara:strand:- start:409 stop:804 length:396 start_codon:yes stop_codon:yes gene_type:complete
MKFLFLLILLISCSTISVAETIVFSAYPIKKTEIFNFTSSDIKLKDQEYLDYQCIIVKKNDKYYWKSREYKELLKVESGSFHIFIAKNGAGYIKIKKEQIIGLDYLYMEHIHLGLDSITYFGHLGSYKAED